MMKSCPLWLNAFADLLRFLVLSLRSESALAAENLFLRKQLAFYKERKIRPRRTTHPARLTLLWLSHWFNWRSALTVVTPKTFGWHRKGFQLFWRRKMPIWPAADSARPSTSNPQDSWRETLMGRGANCKRVAAEIRPVRVAPHHPE